MHIRHHHDSSRADEQHQKLVRSVEVANFLCSRKGIMSTGVPNLRVPKPEVFAGLALDRDGLKVLIDDLGKELEKANELMKV